MPAGGGGGWSVIRDEDVTGLVFACVAGRGDGRALERLDLPGLDAALAAPAGIVWAHLNVAATRAQAWLARCEHLPEPARDLLLGGDRRTRVDRIGEGIVGCLVDLHAAPDADPYALVTLRFYLGPNCLITARRRPAQAALRVRQAVEGGLRPESSADLAIILLDAVVADIEERLDALGETIDRVEHRAVTELEPAARRDLRDVRRVVVRWRGQTLLHRHAVLRMAARLPAWLDDERRFELRAAIEQLEGIGDELRLLDDRAAILDDEIAARLAEATNRNLFALSVVTAIFLPMTLVTGVFGMNVAGLPGMGDPAAFWWVMLGMGAAAGLLYALMRWRGLF